MTGRSGDILDPSDNLLASPAGPWAMEKHAELARYIDATWGARAKWKTSAYIDLFCGPGRQYVEDTQEFIDGSPLVAWKASTKHSASFRQMLLADTDIRYVEACRGRMNAIGAPAEAVEGEAVARAKWAASIVDSRGLQLAFLDPFNLKHLPWAVFEPLVGLPHIDFIVHFSQQDLTRNLDRYIAKEQSILDAFAPGWRAAVGHRDKVQMRGMILEYWISLFSKHGFNPARRMPIIRTDSNVPLYRLIFLSRHAFPKGIWEKLETSSQRALFG